MAKFKDKLASALGSVLEWYDFALYGFFAHIISKLYFPSASSSIGLLKTFSIFAVGFFARPLGSLIFGYIGDKYGRATSLKITPLLITLHVFMFLPNFLNEILNVTTNSVVGDSAFSLLIRLSFIPLIGLLADKIGGVIIARTACILYLVFSYPLFSGILQHTEGVSLFILSFAILTTLNAGTTPGLLVSLLSPQTRCSILSFSFNFSFGVFGGIVPLVSFLLIQKFDSPIASTYYLMFAALVTFISTFFVARTHSHVNQ